MTATITEFRGYSAMSRNRRKGPSKPRMIGDPAERARNGDPTTWGANDEALQLLANADVAIQQGRGVEGKRRVRYDVFALMFYAHHSRLAEQSYLAVRRLQADLAILHRTQGASDAIRTSGQAQTGALAVVAHDFSMARVMAGDRINVVSTGMRPANWRLMQELCEAEAIKGQTPNWQAIVVKHTGEHRHAAKYERVRAAADDLAESYRRIDNEPRERVA